MIFRDGEKFACQQCITGHRVSNCKHMDRLLIHVKQRGRPVKQCSQCRRLRRTRNRHAKCECECECLTSGGNPVLQFGGIDYADLGADEQWSDNDQALWHDICWQNGKHVSNLVQELSEKPSGSVNNPQYGHWMSLLPSNPDNDPPNAFQLFQSSNWDLNFIQFPEPFNLDVSNQANSVSARP